VKEVLALPAAWAGRLWEHRPRGYVHPRHHHDELELNLVLEGTGRYHVGAQVVDLGPRELLWLFPRQEHILLDASPDFRMWILVLRQSALAAACTAPGNQVLRAGDPPGSWRRRLGGAPARALDRLYAQVLARAPDAAGGDVDAWNAGLVHACLESWRCWSGAAPVDALDLHPAVRTACRLR
jgi:AraC-like ligand binding domain